jgi:hypothetical protein
MYLKKFYKSMNSVECLKWTANLYGKITDVLLDPYSDFVMSKKFQVTLDKMG